MNSGWVYRENSLDAIRLVAAMQIVVLHSVEFIHPVITETLAFQIMELFPGVPIFFFISGFLVSKSYERSPKIFEYVKNRVLRLYPALIVCVAINLAMVWYSGYFESTQPSGFDVAILFFSKATFLQFWNPEFMRGFGDGVLNGSLWTICVELQFYFITPLLYVFFGKSKQIGNKVLVALIVFFLIANRLLFLSENEYSDSLAWKLYRVSFAPWVYMFLAGVLLQRNFEVLASFAQRLPVVLVLGFYIILSVVMTEYGFPTGNAISPLSFLLVCILSFRLAYCQPKFVNRLFKGNDISYGIYIWHMPIVNQMLYFGYSEKPAYVVMAIISSIILAVISWFIIEKPSLKLKRITLNINLAANR